MPVDAATVQERIRALEPRGAVTLVGIGGCGGAGKSTLAASIAGAQVVSTDEFWDGSEFELSRLEREVLEPLARGEGARYRGFDWDRRQLFPGERVVRPEGVVVIEGVCALHRMFRDTYDLRIWVEAPRALRLERGVARDGEAARRTWEEVWMPMEESYIERDRPRESADLIVDGSGGDA
jgi:uridine kinase